jgi:uncharacterized protein YggE
MRYLIILSFLFITPVWAADAPNGTHISLDATAEAMLPNDEVVVIYRIEATGTSPDKLRKAVNSISQTVQARLKKEQGLKQTTLGRRLEILRRYDKVNRKQVREGWKLVQREQLRSKALDRVPGWVDAIEKAGAHLDSLSFRISDRASTAAQSRLRLQAVKQFREKAATMARALDAASFRVLSLQTSNRQPVYPMRTEMAMMKVAGDAAPALNAGEGKISVTVSGVIEVPFRDFPVR